MRIENHYGKDVVCGHIFPIDEIEVGSKWQDSVGFEVTVTTVDIVRSDIHYEWIENGKMKYNIKDAFSWQCRHCLIVKTK